MSINDILFVLLVISEGVIRLALFSTLGYFLLYLLRSKSKELIKLPVEINTQNSSLIAGQMRFEPRPNRVITTRIP